MVNHEGQGEKRILVLSEHGLFRVVGLMPNIMSVRAVDHPEEDPILVSMDQFTRCPEDLPDVSRTGLRDRCRQRAAKVKTLDPGEKPDKIIELRCPLHSTVHLPMVTSGQVTTKEAGM